MLERLDSLLSEHSEVESRLADPTIVSDQKRFVEMSRRYAELSKVVEVGVALRNRLEDLETATEMLTELEGDDREEMRTEVNEATADIERLETEFRLLLLPPDPNEGRNVIMEIRGAEGGEEANLFARDLFEMYQAYAAGKKWNLEVMNSNPTDKGGFSEITFRLSGDEVWPRMKFEAGPHRVQRVPVTESQGRVHTSSATVSVLPEADEIDLEIDPGDIKVDTFRASGAGGQHVNKTESAIRITHLPTNEVVSMQDEKSQLQNRIRAMAVLRSRLLKLEQDKAAADASAQRKDQIGSGGRSEKIRTYNYKENRVSDHRIGLTIHQLDKVLAGDLNEVSDALIMDERARQLAKIEE
ncbi:MAG: peptide chain release factor 1 [Acidimicrobiales bacterium]|nr:peptide chain release factor 1 [Acidimicrobiales bacterium]